MPGTLDTPQIVGSHTLTAPARPARVADAAAWIALVTLTLLLACVPMWSADIWWHLRTGELILERGTVPQTDWFTFTDSDQRWIDLHWGFQLLASALFHWGGVDALVLAKAICLAATVAIAWTTSSRHLPASARAACWLLPVVCLSGRALVRPEMLSLLFLVGWFWILDRAEHVPRLVWCLPIFQIAWVNCHALYVLGFVVWAALLLDRAARLLPAARSVIVPVAARLPLAHLVGLTLVLPLAALVNPYGEEGLLFPLTLYRKLSLERGFYSAVITEFASPFSFLSTRAFPFWYVVAELALWGLTAFSFAWLAIQRRISVFRLTLFAAFTYLAWAQYRNINLFGLVSGLILCSNFSDALRARSGPIPDGATAARPGHAAATWAVTALLAGLALSVVSGAWGEAWGGGVLRFGLGSRPNHYRHEAVRFAGQPGFPRRAYLADFHDAALYIYHHGPDRRVFIDGRLEVSTRRTFRRFLGVAHKMVLSDPLWVSDLRAADGSLPAVVLPGAYRPLVLGVMRTPGWRLVFADRQAAVFLDEETAISLDLPEADPIPLFAPP